MARRTKLGGVVGVVTSVATRALASAAIAATSVVVDSVVDAIEDSHTAKPGEKKAPAVKKRARPLPKVTKKKAAAKKKL